MQVPSFKQEAFHRGWQHIRTAKQVVVQKKLTSVLLLAAMLGGGSKLATAQQGAVKSTIRGAALADTHSPAKASPETQTVIVPNLIDLDVTDAEQAVHSVGLYLSVTGVGDVVLQAPRAGTAVPIGSIVRVSLKNY